jgi:glutathionyl-hydroquinone reductase
VLTPIIPTDTLSQFYGTRNSRQSVYPYSLELILVNNESSEIIRSLNSAFNEFLDEGHTKIDFYPDSLRHEIDEVNSWVYDLYNNGVYKVHGFGFQLRVVRVCLCPSSL